MVLRCINAYFSGKTVKCKDVLNDFNLSYFSSYRTKWTSNCVYKQRHLKLVFCSWYKTRTWKHLQIISITIPVTSVYPHKAEWYLYIGSLWGESVYKRYMYLSLFIEYWFRFVHIIIYFMLFSEWVGNHSES